MLHFFSQVSPGSIGSGGSVKSPGSQVSLNLAASRQRVLTPLDFFVYIFYIMFDDNSVKFIKRIPFPKAS